MEDAVALQRLAQLGPPGLPAFAGWFADEGYPVPVLISDPVEAADAIGIWERLDAARDALGLHPILVGPKALPLVGVMGVAGAAQCAAAVSATAAEAATFDVPAWLAARARTLEFSRPERAEVFALPVDEPGVLWNGPFDRPDVASLHGVQVMLVGGGRASVPAHLQIDSDVHTPVIDAAVVHYLEERFGATLFHARGTRLTLRLPAPLTDPAELAEASWTCAVYAGGEPPEDPEDASPVGGRYWVIAFR
jgi:hypothetical protein